MTDAIPAWQDIRRLLLNDWEGMKEQGFPESILRDWADDAAEFIRRSPALPREDRIKWAIIHTYSRWAVDNEPQSFPAPHIIEHTAFEAGFRAALAFPHPLDPPTPQDGPDQPSREEPINPSDMRVEEIARRYFEVRNPPGNDAYAGWEDLGHHNRSARIEAMRLALQGAHHG